MITYGRLQVEPKYNFHKMIEFYVSLERQLEKKILNAHYTNKPIVIFKRECTGIVEQNVAIEKLYNKLLELGYEVKLTCVEELIMWHETEFNNCWKFEIKIRDVDQQ